MDNLFEKAFDYVLETMGQEQGDDFLFISGIMYSLMKAEPDEELTKDEVLKLAEKIVEAAGCSMVAVLSAERVAAVCYLLENGIKENRFDFLVPATPEQTKQLLLDCDIEFFTDLVDFVAVENEEYYAPEGPVLDRDAKERINKAVSDVVKERDGLDRKIQETEKATEKQGVSTQQAIDFERD